MTKPNDLISPTRLDVFTKTPLAHAISNNWNLQWGLDLYIAYMLATRPSGGFSEDDQKFSLKSYLSSFELLVESIKNHGFDKEVGAIPLGSLGIINGAHRLAASLVLSEPISYLQSEEANHIYDYKFMSEIGLSSVFRDSTAAEYLKYATRSTAYCLMGVSPKKVSEINNSMNILGVKVIYIKSFKLSPIGQRRLMKILYSANNWWSNELLETLTVERFQNSSNVTIFFAEGKTREEEIAIKVNLRSEHFDSFSSKQLHSTDTNFETISIANAVLNVNSLYYNNHSPLGAEDRIISELLSRNDLIKSEKSDFVVDGSATLELFGIRKANDIDLLESHDKFSEFQRVKSRRTEYENIPIDPNQIIQDPRCYMIVDGFKFTALPTVMSFKSYRSEVKDYSDLRQILSQVKSEQIYLDLKAQQNLLSFRRTVRIRRMINRALYPLPEGAQAAIRSTYRNLRNVLRLLP